MKTAIAVIAAVLLFVMFGHSDKRTATYIVTVALYEGACNTVPESTHNAVISKTKGVPLTLKLDAFHEIKHEYDSDPAQWCATHDYLH